MIKCKINNVTVGELDYNPTEREYVFRYFGNDLSPISLIMPPSQRIYLWKYHLHPFFEMYLPEGYLLEIFKNILIKDYGEINDYLLFSLLAPNIEGRVSFQSDQEKNLFQEVDLDDILNYDTEDTFSNLLHNFLKKNAISGVQPKTLATVRDKGALSTREYIVKTWGPEFPQLAENEYFCMQAVKHAGIFTPVQHLSRNRRFLLVKKFDIDQEKGISLGFEEVLGLMGRNREQKYTGSYEQVAKLIFQAATDKLFSMEQYFKLIIMNYFLKNGDAHLKNFGILYDEKISEINISPAYDVVCTVPYLFRDKPALTMFGRKIWFGRKELLEFGEKQCLLSRSETQRCYESCCESVVDTIKLIREHIRGNPAFAVIGKRMIAAWTFSLQGTTHREMPDDVIGTW
ncbi:MAG: type II toxin-antitoxin system HipA family toxin [Pseudomonadota bacterium]|nr:type II toxin-antitoxin system HipA family toxin [Pseudomonadota bacterium]